jgi:iron(III) transport system substrate-binding protein
MRLSRLPRLLVLCALVLATIAPACTSSSGDSLTIYSGRSSDLIKPILDDFAADTGTDITVKYGDSAELALLISEEGAKSPADIFISQTPGAMGFLESEGLLADLSTETLELVPERYRAETGQWVGLSGRRRVIVYNEDLVSADELPDSVLDLTDPEYEGDVAVAPTNGSFQDFVSALRIELGDEATTQWLEGMAANNSPEYANNNAIVEAVSRGEVPMGLVNHYYNLRFLDEDPDLPSRNYYLPGDDVGSLLVFTTAAVLESSDNKEAAEELVQYLLGESAQTYFAEETFEYPLAAGVKTPDVLEPLDEEDVFTIDYSLLGDDFETTLDMIDESGLGG